MENILNIKNLSKSYPDFKLDDVTLELQKGTIMGLIGENGAGKSTLINLILNEIKKDHGSIEIFGKDLYENESIVKQDIGIVFDDCSFNENFYCRDMHTILKSVYENWDYAYYCALLHRFELPENKRIKQFSKGMKVKLCFAVALAHHPKLLILDEATSGLDPVIRDEILDILQDFIQDETHSVLISSHILSDLEKIADYITFIHKGKVLLSETKDSLIYDYGILRCGQNLFDALNKEDIIAYKKEDYEWKVMVNNKQSFQSVYPDAVVDTATIEDIMLFYIKGEHV